MLNKIKTKVKEYKKLTEDRLNDIYASTLVGKLLHQGNYIPITNSSLSLYSIAITLNDIVVNQRTKIVEFGSGISTILMARLLSQNGIKGRIYSVEEDSEWSKIISDILEKEGLKNFVEFINAPLASSQLSLQENVKWYSGEILGAKFNSITDIDLVLVDGPSAWHEEIQFARYPAFPFLKDKLASCFSFYLDDVNRFGEKKILEHWEKEMQVKFLYLSNTFAVTRKGSFYESAF